MNECAERWQHLHPVISVERGFSTEITTFESVGND